MNTLALLRASKPEMTDAEFLTWVNTPTYTESSVPVLVTYQKLRAMLTKAKVDAIAAVVSQADAIGHQLLFTTGVSVNHPDSKMLLATLPSATQGIVTTEDCDAIRNMARSVSRMGPYTQEDLDALPRLEAIKTLEDANRTRYNDNVMKLDKMQNDFEITVPASLSELDEVV